MTARLAVFACAVAALGLALAAPDAWAAMSADELDRRLAELEQTQHNLNHVWTMVAAALVFFMQGGFMLLEAGSVRSKNSINVAQKNIADMVLAITLFGLIGFSVMFGATIGGFVGFSTDLMAFDQVDDWTYTFFVFQAVFCGTAATVVSGAVAERMKFTSYLIITILIAVLIYPVFGHLAWGNLLIADQAVYLADKGFIDFAGSTVVHSVGGWIALAAVLVVGPRIGRFDANGKPVTIQGHSPVLATLGALILWIGWIGFNGGSTTAGTADFASIVANTVIAGAMGGTATMVAARVLDGFFRPDRSINGVLGGLVAITAGCDLATVWGAVFLGLSGGLVALAAQEIMEHRFKIDDAVGAIAVHGVAGAWGTLMIAFIAPSASLPAGDTWSQFLVQLEGVVIAFVWAFGVAWTLLKLIDRYCGGLRVDPEHEIRGLNDAEHGTVLGTGDLLKELTRLGQGHADFSVRLDDRTGDEAGELAVSFNSLMDQFERLMTSLTVHAGDLRQAADSMVDLSDLQRGASRTAAATASQAHRQVSEMSGDMETMAQTLVVADTMAQSIAAATRDMHEMVGAASRGARDVAEAITEIRGGMGEAEQVASVARQGAQGAERNIDRLVNAIEDIGDSLSLIDELAERTTMLALNATIEAERAGAAGKSFAVVASEVKSLSNRTGTAVDHIRSSIEAVRREASTSVQSIAGIGEVTERISQAVEAMTQAVERQNAAAQTISERMATAQTQSDTVSDQLGAVVETVRNSAAESARAAKASQEVAKGLADVDKVVGETAAQAEQASAAADTVRDISQRLMESTGQRDAPAGAAKPA